MTFLGKAEVLPPLFGQQGNNIVDPYAEKRLQTLRWLVLLGTFSVVLLIGMIYVWSRPAQFQSKAILHFSYVSAIGGGSETIPLEQISLNQERLTSFRVLQKVSDRLLLTKNIALTAEQLSQMLSTFAQTTSRTINLLAIGKEPKVLEPVLTTWLETYLGQLSAENDVNKGEDLSLIAEKLESIEIKISQQRDELMAFSEANNIISLERDENRILNKIKSLGTAIDGADAKQAEAKASLVEINKAISKGQVLIRPEDKASLDEAKNQISGLKSTLAELAEQFTPEYMGLDPKIVSMQRNLDKLVPQLQEKIASSQQAYLNDSERKLAEAETHARQMSQQLQVLSVQAHDFNQKLDQYKRLDESLKQLQNQAQELQNQLVEQEVEQPKLAKITIVEPPFNPEFAIGPDYIQDSLIVVGVALGSSLFSLLVFSFIVRQKLQPQATVTNYTLMPNTANQQGLGHHPHDHEPAFALANQKVVEPLQLQNNSATAASVAQLRILSESECILLFNAASQQGKLVIALLLSGLAPDELSHINRDLFDQHFENLHIPGRYARTLSLPAVLSDVVNKLALAEGDSLWTETMVLDDFNHLLVNAAHDADIAFAEQLSVAALRHSYITNLLVQGCKLNDLEKVAGYITASELGQYRGVKRQGQALTLEQLNTIFALANVAT
jgi:succinoglycan biosynthesis transport protein ExoP